MAEPESNVDSEPRGPEALEDLTLRAAELSEHLGSYLRAQTDKVAYSFKKALRAALFGFILIVLFFGIVLCSVAFLFYGAAMALNAWLGIPWLGYLIVGATMLLILGLWIRFGLFGKSKKALQKQIKDYENELRAQQAQYGANAVGRAAGLAE